ncbi:hypothetical protein CgIS1_09655 [Frankia sp. CgS1]|nr:hypothetical protein CgIS1_09655 [Frankia sp. CgIS1]
MIGIVTGRPRAIRMATAGMTSQSGSKRGKGGMTVTPPGPGEARRPDPVQVRSSGRRCAGPKGERTGLVHGAAF